MKRLNIFIDETGEFGFNKRSAKLYGVSFVFHEQSNDISNEIEKLKQNMQLLGFSGMVHMGDLVAGHGDFSGMSIAKRRKIYNALYRFSTRIKATYSTIIINKHDIKNNAALSKTIERQIQNVIVDSLVYFQSFDQIVVYYDGGQKPLNKIVSETFLKLNSAMLKSDFDHVEKKIFQVADMLTYVDKLIYKYQHKERFTATESAFFSPKLIKYTIIELGKHRFKPSK